MSRAVNKIYENVHVHDSGICYYKVSFFTSLEVSEIVEVGFSSRAHLNGMNMKLFHLLSSIGGMLRMLGRALSAECAVLCSAVVLQLSTSLQSCSSCGLQPGS